MLCWEHPLVLRLRRWFCHGIATYCRCRLVRNYEILIQEAAEAPLPPCRSGAAAGDRKACSRTLRTACAL